MPKQKPMAWKMADLEMCRESVQTLWNSLYMFANGFPTAFGLVNEDLRWIPTCPKSADFEQKAWAIAHGFLKMADLGMCRESFQTLWNALYMFANGFPTAFGLVHEDLRWIPTCPKSADFEQNAWAIAHGFEDGGFGYVPGIVPNSLKRLVHVCKWISNYFRACWWRFGVN